MTRDSGPNINRTRNGFSVGTGRFRDSCGIGAVRRHRPRTFLANQVECLVSMDFFTGPTLTGHVLLVLVLLAHHRRRIFHFTITVHPTAAWTAQQIIEALPDDTAPRTYYHGARTHLSLGKDTPAPRRVQPPNDGAVIAFPEVGGLHHRYERRAA